MILPSNYNPVVFFSSEFAIDSDLPTYAGGLGVLAGDYMNICAQNHMQMVGIGILYRGLNFVQHIAADGKEEKRDSQFDHDTSFLRPTTINGQPVILTIPSPDGEIKVKAYHLRLSDETLQFFLSTNVDGNPDHWRADMNTLYSGDTDAQIRQEILLGVGGMKLIEKLKMKPKLYHFNEGRPVFAIWEIMRPLVEKGASFEDAWQQARLQIVYTNHTLVAAGNPKYNPDTVKYWAGPFADSLHISQDELIAKGVVDGGFSITDYALQASHKHNAVSKVHGKYCKKDYPQYSWTAITNGVYMFRWQDSDFRRASITDKEVWDLHMLKKRELERTVEQRTGVGYDTNRLVITWARRLAEYKQPKAIFEDITRLKKIVSNLQTPVQILFAGNSHSASPNAKNLIDELIYLFATELSGHAIFIPNYNISLANHLVSGSDIWLNTPKGNLEACGTSGMKAISNGVLNCTVLDGWTYEVDWDGVGWNLDPDHVSESFYTLMENEIVPEYYKRNDAGLPEEWIARMRKSVAIANQYSAERMLHDYQKKMYS